MSKKGPDDILDLVFSSASDIKAFESSQIWKDMKAILEDWDAGLREDYDEAESFEEIRTVQGISRCIKYVLNLPDAMILLANEKQGKE